MKLVPVNDAKYACDYVNALFDAMKQPKRRFLTDMIDCLNGLGKHGGDSRSWFEARLISVDGPSIHRSIRISAHRAIELRLHDAGRADGREAWSGVVDSLTEPGCLIYLDLDQFKTVNDRQGHMVGDALLRSFAHHLRGHFRASDSVFRWGGDEFVLVVPTITLDQATQKVTRLQDKIAPLVQFSFGIASFDSDTCLSAALERADQSLYRQKNKS
jgi:diguanylate cyclase (GGDEF)-like protein